MNIKQYFANQLAKPAGIWGKFFLGRLWNKRNVALNDCTLTHLQLKENDSVLEIGFGGGYLLHKIIPVVKDGFVVGIDPSEVLVNKARRRWKDTITTGRVKITTGYAEVLDYPSETFSKICSVNSIFYWNDVERGIVEIYRCLQMNGFFVLTFTCKADLKEKWFTRYGIRTYETEEIQHTFAKTGFKNIDVFQNRDKHRTFFTLKGEK